MSITIYHNPRCSKSRQTLSILKDKGIEIDIIEYLQSPPDAATLTALIKKLGITAKDLVRKGEAEFKLAGLDNKNITDEEMIQAMVKYPKLIERPIVVNKDKAVLGRPPENVLTILE